MPCFVYKSQRQHNYYLYLNRQLDQSELPKKLLDLLGELSFVIEFDLHEDKPLAQVDAKQVLADIRQQGYFLQMPKDNCDD